MIKIRDLRMEATHKVLFEVEGLQERRSVLLRPIKKGKKLGIRFLAGDSGKVFDLTGKRVIVDVQVLPRGEDAA